MPCVHTQYVLVPQLPGVYTLECTQLWHWHTHTQLQNSCTDCCRRKPRWECNKTLPLYIVVNIALLKKKILRVNSGRRGVSKNTLRTGCSNWIQYTTLCSEQKVVFLLHTSRFSDLFGMSTFAVRLSDLAWDSPRFPDHGPCLRHFNRNIHEKYGDLKLYIHVCSPGLRRPAEWAQNKRLVGAGCIWILKNW